MYWQVDFNSTFAVKLINVQDRRAVAADTCELIVNAPGENARWKRYLKKCMYTPLSLLAAATGVKLMNVLYIMQRATQAIFTRSIRHWLWQHCE